MLNSGIWTDSRDSNLLDGAAHFYGCYECKDGKFVSIGSIEPQFYSLLREKMNIDEKEIYSHRGKAIREIMNTLIPHLEQVRQMTKKEKA